MDPVTATIVTALVAGAAAAAKNVASAAVKDAYAGLKRLISDRYQKVGSSVEAVEVDPSSKPAQQVLAKRLDQEGAGADGDLQKLAGQLLEAVEQLREEPQATALFDFNQLRAARNFELEDIQSIGTILRAKDATIEGDFKAKGIRQTLPRGDAPRNVRFTVYHPKEIKPDVWCTLLAYVHILEMQSMVEADAKQRLEVPHGRRISEATHSILRGAEIVVIPELPGCRFNPTSAHLLWLEDWHRVEFRLQAQPYLAGFELGKAVNGRVAFYVESVLVGEVPIWTCISDEADTTAADTPASTASAEPYEAIFVSYAHEDSAIVDRLGRAYKVLGMEFLRDVETLRSGEKWNHALLAMIERADIFQLYWSNAAKRSRYVKAEWRHALKQEKSHFIRPLYWQVPMPKPPRALAQLHFSYLKQDGVVGERGRIYNMFSS